MATSDEIKQRASALAEKTDVNSITPKEVGGIMYDLASHSENVLRNGGTLGIRKVYESVAAMEADSTNPKDFWGDPIKKGNLVVIYDGTNTGVDNNKIYAFLKPGWQIATHLDAGYATKASLDAAIENILLQFRDSENALNESIGNLEETVTGNKQEVDAKLSELGSKVVGNSLALYDTSTELDSVILTRWISSVTNSYNLKNGEYTFRFSLQSESDKTVYIVIRDSEGKQLLSANIAVGSLSLEKDITVQGSIDINIAHYGSERDSVIVKTDIVSKNNLANVVKNINKEISGNKEGIKELLNEIERLSERQKDIEHISDEIKSIDSSFENVGNIYTGEYQEGFISSVIGNIQTDSSLPNATSSKEQKVIGGKVYCISGRAEVTGIVCYDGQGIKKKVLAAETGIERGDWYLPSNDGGSYVANGQFKTPEGAVKIAFGISLYKEYTDTLNRIVLELVGDTYDENFTPSTFEGYDNVKKVIKESSLPDNLLDKSYYPLRGKTIAFIGDSAIQTGNCEMTERCAKLLGVKEYYNYAMGGYTWKNKFKDGEYDTCCKLLIDRLINGGKKPDIIIFQIGGNDLGYLSELGSIESAFSQYNYKTLAEDTSIYGGIRYNLQRTIETFPNSNIIVGTVFQRRGSDASKIATPIREVCARLGIPIIEGNLYSGISRYTELDSPVYSDNPDGGNRGSRDYPQYMWVESDGTISSNDSKSDNAVKVYGKYTYDGTHRTLEGDYHIAEWMASQIASVYGL